MDQNQKRWRKSATAVINKENPNKLTEIIRWVKQLIAERRKKSQKKAAGAE